MFPDKDQLRKNYESFDDEKLIRLATEEATELRPEALELIRKIIRERGLPEDIMRGIDDQFQNVDEEILSDYTELLRKLPCPICKSENEKLNATIAATAISYVVITNYTKEFIIACPDCLDKKNSDAIFRSGWFGWWGFPSGIFKTIQALIFNNKMKKQNRLTEANDLFKSFTFERIGRIETNRNNPEELQMIITHLR